MSRTIFIEEHEINLNVGKELVASFEGTYSGDLIEGAIDESYETKLNAAQLIALAQWLLEKAAERSRDEKL